MTSKQEWLKVKGKLYQWLDSPGNLVRAKLDTDALHILPVHWRDDEVPRIDSPLLSPGDSDSILQAGAKLGWTDKAPILLTANSYRFLAVPTTKLDVFQSQKDREIGLNAANFVDKLDVAQVLCLGSTEVDALGVWQGLVQGLFKVRVFKRDEKISLPEFIGILDPDKANKTRCDSAVAMAQSDVFARFLGEAPPNWLDSEMMGTIASECFKDLSGVKVTVKGRKSIVEMGMGAFASVAKGTEVEPRLISIEIEGDDPSKTIALIGKGLTFDSGGISLKKPQGMEEMKYDMCGGAAVLGAAHYFSRIAPPVNVVCLVGAVENMPFNGASRPGDVVTALNGKSIEIVNTDAEGRLVLADILHYAATHYKPEFMVDVATLTGAIVIALGQTTSGMMTNSKPLASHLLKSAEDAGEPLWHLPLLPEHDKELRSKVADLKNIPAASVGGKSLAAASFLKHFVGDTPWAHIDIAGTAWNCRATGFPGSGASAFSMRTLVSCCQNPAEFL